MVYYVTGSNIFGQWSWRDSVLNEFRVMSDSKHELDAHSERAKLVQINWSYNILQIANNFYISGFWDGRERQFVKVPLPVECREWNENEDFIVAGNDYKLVLISKSIKTLWVIDLKMEKDTKKLKNIEEPVENVEKRQKRDNSISKVVLVNDSCVYLTSMGNVYSGILPSYVDTRHCRGQICDVQCGHEHYVLLTDSGVVYTWGSGRRLQLGHGDISNLEVPTEVEALAGIKVVKICSGGWHSLALSEFGDLYVWGWNDCGQLGIKHDKEGHESCPVPTLVDLFDNNGINVSINVKDIACGSRHSAILLQDNTVWTSGYNKYGQLGFPGTVTSFKKVFKCDNNCTLMCGPWTTVIVTD